MELKIRENPCYCINLRRTANTITKLYDQEFEKIGASVSQLSLLGDIRSLKQCNRTDLAKYSKLDRTTIVRNVNVLLKKELVEEVVEGNKKLLILTQKGYDLTKEGFSLWKGVQKKIEDLLGIEKIEILKQVFNIFNNLEVNNKDKKEK